MLQTEFMRANELPYAPLAPGAMDAELRAALAAVQRFKGEMEAANAVEQGAKDHQFYEVPTVTPCLNHARYTVTWLQIAVFSRIACRQVHDGPRDRAVC